MKLLTMEKFRHPSKLQTWYDGLHSAWPAVYFAWGWCLRFDEVLIWTQLEICYDATKIFYSQFPGRVKEDGINVVGK